MKDNINKGKFQGEVADNNRIVLGLIAAEENYTLIEKTIQKAIQFDYKVFIVPLGGSDFESVELAYRLGATVLELDDATTDMETLRDHLVSTAKRRSYSGIIVQADPTAAVDFERDLRMFDQDTNVVTRSSTPKMEMTKMTDSCEVVVGIPAYNEEISIGSTILSAQWYADDVIVVDDGSFDDTSSIANEAGATVIEHETNQGKGSAIQTLFEYARSLEFEVLVLFDADGQHVAEDIPIVSQAVLENDADLVIGSRYMGTFNNETPLLRRLGQKTLDFLTVHSSKITLTDTQSGFRALSSTTVDELKIRTNGIGVESEIVDQAARKNLSIVEVPIHVRYDGVDGQTYNPIHHGMAVSMFLLQLVRDRHPLVFFGIPGILLIFVGAFYSINAILIYQSTGNFYAWKILVGGIMTIIGVLGVFCGLILNRITNMIQQVRMEG